MSKVKYLAVAAIISAVFVVLPGLASAQSGRDSVADLQDQIQNMLAQVQALQAQLAQVQGNQGQTWCHTFNTNLKIGDQNSEVAYLVGALIREGLLQPGAGGGGAAGETIEQNPRTFDEEIASAVSGFQEKYRREILIPARLAAPTGYVGERTRAKLNALYGCGAGGNVSGDMFTASPANQTITAGLSGWFVVTPLSTASAGAGAITLGVSGGLPAGVSVTFSSITLDQSGTSRGTISVPSGTAAGSYAFTVVGTRGGATQRFPMSILVNSGTATTQPSITNITPSQGVQGQNITLTIRGSGFLQVANISGNALPVSLGGMQLMTSRVDSDSQITATYSISTSATLGTAQIGVGGSNTMPFSIVAAGASQPTITTISPSSGQIGTDVIITGSGFTPTNNTIYVGIHYLGNTRVSSNNGTQLGFMVPNVWSDGTAVVPGYYRVFVSNVNGTSNYTGFTIVAAGASQPSIRLSGSSGGQVSDSSISVNVGSTFTISGTPQGLQGLSYYYGNGYPTFGYYSRAFFFDQNFGNNNLCGNNEASATGVWTMTCTAKVLGSSTFYVEIYANGQTYKSNVVTVNVAGATQPTVSVSPGRLDFTATQGGGSPADQILSVSGTNVSWYIAVAVNGGPPVWLSTNLTPGQAYVNNGAMLVHVNPTGLSAGTYSGSITIYGSVGSPIVIPVTLMVTATNSAVPTAALSVNPSAITAGQATNLTWSSTGATSCTLTGTNGYNDNGGWSKIGLTASGSMSVTPFSSLQTSYTAKYQIACTGSGGTSSPASATLTVTVAPSATPSVSVSPGRLDFTATQGGSNPSPQVLSVTGTNVAWVVSVASTPGGWLSTNLTGGTYVNNGAMYVYANQSGLSAGTYNGTVTISSTGNPAVNVPVTLTVSAAPSATAITLTTDKTAYNVGDIPTYIVTGLSGNYANLTLTYTGPSGSACPNGCTQSNISVNVVGGRATFSGSNPWPSSASGQWSAYISDGTRASQAISFTVSAAPSATPTVSVSPTTLSFSAAQAGANPAAQEFIITNTSAQNVSASWSTSVAYQSGSGWLTLTPVAGSSPSSIPSSPCMCGNTFARVTTSANVQGLSAGSYNATVTISGNFAGSPVTIPVTLAVTGASAPALTVQATPTAPLNFSIQAGAAPSGQSMWVGFTVNPNQTIYWTAQPSASWIGVTPSGLASNGGGVYITLSSAASSLAAGSYNGTITFSPTPGASPSFSPQTVNVTLIVAPAPAAAAPTAYLVANNSLNVAVNVGQTVYFNWNSSNAVSASSVYTVNSADTCGSVYPQQNSWVANTLSGSTQVTIPVCEAGHTYTISYTAANATGQKSTATVTVSVIGSPSQALSDSQLANTLESMKLLLEQMAKLIR